MTCASLGVCALPICRICQKPPQNATSRSHQRKSFVQGKLPIWPFLSTWSTRGILAGILRSMKLAGGDFGEIALRFAPNNFWETDDVIRSIVSIVIVDFFLTYCDIMPIETCFFMVYIRIYIRADHVNQNLCQVKPEPWLLWPLAQSWHCNMIGSCGTLKVRKKFKRFTKQWLNLM